MAQRRNVFSLKTKGNLYGLSGSASGRFLAGPRNVAGRGAPDGGENAGCAQKQAERGRCIVY